MNTKFPEEQKQENIIGEATVQLKGIVEKN